MRNHDQKARDMARSLLASTHAKGARDDRRLAHHCERARLRAELHRLTRLADPLDHEGDLTWTAKGDIDDLVGWRRAWDNSPGFQQWVERTIETDPTLRHASPDEQRQHFAERLPPGMTGRHALFHVTLIVDPMRW